MLQYNSTGLINALANKNKNPSMSTKNIAEFANPTRDSIERKNTVLVLKKENVENTASGSFVGGNNSTFLKQGTFMR